MKHVKEKRTLFAPDAKHEQYRIADVEDSEFDSKTMTVVDDEVPNSDWRQLEETGPAGKYYQNRMTGGGLGGGQLEARVVELTDGDVVPADAERVPDDVNVYDWTKI